MLLRVLDAQGSYLAAALSAAPRFGRIHGSAERGQVGLALVLHQSASLAAQLVRATTPQEWSAPRALLPFLYPPQGAHRRPTSLVVRQG